jgi:hypothetical protein
MKTDVGPLGYVSPVYVPHYGFSVIAHHDVFASPDPISNRVSGEQLSDAALQSIYVGVLTSAQ